MKSGRKSAEPRSNCELFQCIIREDLTQSRGAENAEGVWRINWVLAIFSAASAFSAPLR
jgi:hypothetical protein